MRVLPTDKGWPSMAFTPTQSPVYGGGTLFVRVSVHQPGAQYFVVFEGTRRRHVVSARRSPDSHGELLAYIPGHDLAEEVTVTLVEVKDDQGQGLCYNAIASCYFQFEYDSTFFMTKFLTSSVYNDHALDNMELIKSDRFDLSNEVLSTLDTRLARALRNSNLRADWHLLGGDSISDAHCEDRETLLHFCARLGLHQVATFLLERPGSEDALRLCNRHGELPAHLARAYGFDGLAEMLSGYNTHGLVTEEEATVEVDNAVLRNYGNGTASLTSFLDAPNMDRGVENEIDFLRETEEMIRVQKGITPPRQYDSDWPNIDMDTDTRASRPLPPMDLDTPTSPDTPTDHVTDGATPTMDAEVEESLQRLMNQQDFHRDNLHSFLRTSSLPSSQHPPRGGGGGEEGGNHDDGGHSLERKRKVSPHSLGETGRARSVSDSDQVNSEQDYHSGDYSNSKDSSKVSDKEHIGYIKGKPRSGSIPSGSKPPSGPNKPPFRSRGTGGTYSVLEDSLGGVRDLTQSLLLVRDAEAKHRAVRKGARNLNLRPSSSCPSLSHPKHSVLSPIDEGGQHKSLIDFADQLTSPSQSQSEAERAQTHSPTPRSPRSEAVRICLNGVTVDSSEDIPVDGGDQDMVSTRQGAWHPDTAVTDLTFDRRDQQTRVMMLAMSGKSLSLTSLEDQDSMEYEDDHDVTEAERQAAAMVGVAIGAIGQRAVSVEDRSVSPVDSCASSPTGHDESVTLRTQEGSQENLGSARSLSDLSSPCRPQSFDGTSSHVVAPQMKTSHLSFDEGRAIGGLAPPTHSMTKSLSTPSIPMAVDAKGERPKRREGKHNDEDYQRFLEEYEQSPGDSDDKAKKAGAKEDKKRKPSVFSRFQKSYGSRKSKDKDTKTKERHRFVAVSFSNTTACDACHKPMANKAALRCENCLVNVHEHNCKEQIQLCDKTRNKALQRDGSLHGPHGPPQPTSQGPALERQDKAQGGALRPSLSFKDKRSVSAPMKPQQASQQLAAPAPHLAHRHSLPNNSLFSGSPPSGSFLHQWQLAQQARFSVRDKAISEETESDTVTVSSMETSQTNMTDTISDSIESLEPEDVPHTEVSCLDDEPDLQLFVEEPEAWSITVDRKYLKKLNSKDIKRQDTIWELINTEKQYVKRLKIMQKIFAQTMIEEMNYTSDQIERLFPRIDDLVELHSHFLRQLLERQASSEDRFIENIGDILVNQFHEEAAEAMKSTYGVFCSKHTEAMQWYKEYVRVDKKFQNYAKKVTALPVCEKREITDFILGVTVRLSKYPILIEAILKSTKDKKDREHLSQALLLAKEVVQHIDEKVAAYEKLVDIQGRLDSRAVMYRGKKFKRQDLTAEHRELLHSGKIGWKSARGRVYDVLAVVLTDLIVFLQKNEQKYTFLMQDNKSCVIPLYRLLVREKRDAKDALGIYMISQNNRSPEMYELVCKSKGEREEWVKLLDDAIRASPQEQEPVQEANPPSAAGAHQAVLNEEERRRREEHATQMRDIIEQLHAKDELIQQACDEKNDLMVKLMEFSSQPREPGSRPSSQEIFRTNESVLVVKAAIDEASKLTSILSTSTSALSRSVSSVGEHHSSYFVATPVPKRAETFAGFDSNHESPKRQRYALPAEEIEASGRPASMHSLNESEGADAAFMEPSEAQEAPAPSPMAPHGQSPQQHSHLWDSDVSSGSLGNSLGEMSAVSMGSLVPGTQEQMMSMHHLVQHLNTLMKLTNQQCTQVQSLRVELAEAKEEIHKLSAELHGRRGGGGYRHGHGQLEELRNLQENISRERQEWERVKAEDRNQMQEEKAQLEQDRTELEHERVELQTRREDLKRQREALQRQMDMMREQGVLPLGEEEEEEGGPTRPAGGHRRSASADFYNSPPVSGDESAVQPASRHPRMSTGSLGLPPPNAGTAAAKQAGLPIHLLSAKNEQRLTGGNVQRLPLKLSGSNSVVTSGAPTHHTPPIAPSAAFSAGRQQPFPGRGGPGVCRVQSMSSASRSAAAQQRYQERQSSVTQLHSGGDSAPANLSNLMKLADPKDAKKVKAGSVPPKEQKENASGEVLYF